jgi:hypothetical protein
MIRHGRVLPAPFRSSKTRISPSLNLERHSVDSGFRLRMLRLILYGDPTVSYLNRLFYRKRTKQYFDCGKSTMSHKFLR